jgi:predicted metalloprotease
MGEAGERAPQESGKQPMIEPGDVEAALRTAAAIGDDTLQRRCRAMLPDSFTHGSSAQRQRWFEAGFRSGSVKAATPSRRTAVTSVPGIDQSRGSSRSNSRC